MHVYIARLFLIGKPSLDSVGSRSRPTNRPLTARSR